MKSKGHHLSFLVFFIIFMCHHSAHFKEFKPYSWDFRSVNHTQSNISTGQCVWLGFRDSGLDPGLFFLWIYTYSDTRWLLGTQIWCQVALRFWHPLHCDLHPADSSSRWSGSWLPHRCQGDGRYWGGNLKTHYLKYGS